MQVQLGSSRMGGTSLEAENVNKHYKHAVADDHAVACSSAGTQHLFEARRL